MRKISSSRFVLILAVAFLSLSVNLAAQGSIFGLVSNSDLSPPGSDDLSFYGFLNDTDEEIRLESSIGAGYDGGHWYDDFQNYLTETAGNPFQFRFYNTANGEGLAREGVVPDSSYHQEDILLSDVSWPPAPVAVKAVRQGDDLIEVTWSEIAGCTYHIYRREAASDGSLFRIDDPSGSLVNPGVSVTSYLDSDVVADEIYEYVVISENGSGMLGQHSQVAMSEESQSFLCGDTDGNGIMNMSDAVYIIAYIFGGGPAPEPLLSGDVDCNAMVNMSDVVYILSFIFAGGPAPCADCP
jgi:hypothetical protein